MSKFRMFSDEALRQFRSAMNRTGHRAVDISPNANVWAKDSSGACDVITEDLVGGIGLDAVSREFEAIVKDAKR